MAVCEVLKKTNFKAKSDEQKATARKAAMATLLFIFITFSLFMAHTVGLFHMSQSEANVVCGVAMSIIPLIFVTTTLCAPQRSLNPDVFSFRKLHNKQKKGKSERGILIAVMPILRSTAYKAGNVRAHHSSSHFNAPSNSSNDNDSNSGEGDPPERLFPHQLKYHLSLINLLKLPNSLIYPWLTYSRPYCCHPHLTRGGGLNVA